MISRYRMQNPMDQISLHRNLSTPSTIHGYSLAVEYMKNWFLKQFDDEYFKTVHINGKHVFDDYRRFNKTELLKIEKPAVAIIPSVNFDYDRDTLDLYLGGRDLAINRVAIIQNGFLQDHDNNVYLGLQLQQLEMPFTFRIRVKTRAEQIDLYEYMKLAFRVGSTQGEDISMDFHVPSDIMLNIATDAGFEIKDNKVVDVVGFLSYLNGHSTIPFTYKFRTINGNSEFFIRLDNLYVHINNTDKLSLDDGEREGQLDNNFSIEMNCTLQIPIPHFYFYFTNRTIQQHYKAVKDLSGLYSFKIIQPPARNSKGWLNYLSTDYIDNSKYLSTIDFKELIQGDLLKVCKFNQSMGLSPAIFMDIIIFNGQKQLDIDIDWETLIVTINKEVPDEDTKICIYVDKEYVNDKLLHLQKANNTRLS